MPAIYRFLGTHEVLIYILLCIGAMFGLRWLWRSWHEWRHAIYSLEREFALRRMGQSAASVILLVLLFFIELSIATFILPGLPAAEVVQTSTPSLLATPIGTISPEVATEIALAPRPAEQPAARGGCVKDAINISSPETGEEVRGIVEIRGTVDIPDFGFYKYEAVPSGSDAWSTIAAGRSTIRDGLLGQWDTTSLPPGNYVLRLVASDNQGRALPACQVQVRVPPQS